MRCPVCGGEEYILVYNEKKGANCMKCPIHNNFMGWKSVIDDQKERKRLDNKKYYEKHRDKLVEYQHNYRKQKKEAAKTITV